MLEWIGQLGVGVIFIMMLKQQCKINYWKIEDEKMELKRRFHGNYEETCSRRSGAWLQKDLVSMEVDFKMSLKNKVWHFSFSKK